jgi:hypothetical protein
VFALKFWVGEIAVFIPWRGVAADGAAIPDRGGWAIDTRQGIKTAISGA